MPVAGVVFPPLNAERKLTLGRVGGQRMRGTAARMGAKVLDPDRLTRIFRNYVDGTGLSITGKVWSE